MTGRPEGRVELAITFLEDKPKGFGLGLGFFKANLIR